MNIEEKKANIENQIANKTSLLDGISVEVFVDFVLDENVLDDALGHEDFARAVVVIAFALGARLLQLGGDVLGERALDVGARREQRVQGVELLVGLGGYLGILVRVLLVQLAQEVNVELARAVLARLLLQEVHCVTLAQLLEVHVHLGQDVVALLVVALGHLAFALFGVAEELVVLVAIGALVVQRRRRRCRCGRRRSRRRRRRRHCCCRV